MYSDDITARLQWPPCLSGGPGCETAAITPDKSSQKDAVCRNYSHLRPHSYADVGLDLDKGRGYTRSV